MNRRTFVAALNEQRIPATVVEDHQAADDELAVWVDLEHELADPAALHRATTIAGGTRRFDDWLDDLTTTADEATLAWLTRWDLA